MKIEFIISSLGGGGAERVLTLMANSLAKNDSNEISVISLHPGEEVFPFDSRVKRVKLKQNKFISNLTLRSISNLFSYYRNKSNRPDIIISLSTTTNFIAIIIAKLFSIKIIGQEHISYLKPEGKKRFILGITRKYLYKKADQITVLTSFDIAYYENFGVNVSVMPNPCSFKPLTDNSHKREKTILAIGNLNRYYHKGFDNLIELIAPVLKENPDWTLKIAGSGEEGLKYLTQLAVEKNILNKIVFTGFVENISKLMNESSIFILSSRYEGLPMVLLEAMSQGMACIAYNCLTGPSDIIENDKNGLLIENQNIIKMQQGLRDLISNDQLRNKVSNEGIKSLNKFNIDTITARYEALIDEIVNKP